MDNDFSPPGSAATEPGLAADARETLRQRETWVPLFAVGAVALAALIAVLVPARAKHESEISRSATVERAANKAAPVETPATPVVKAPPLAPARSPAQAMGGAAACTNCGVVENVVAVHGRANGKVEAVGFLMNIRMDDGTTRTVEQRGALAAGSRVVVEGDAVRALGPGS